MRCQGPCRALLAHESSDPWFVATFLEQEIEAGELGRGVGKSLKSLERGTCFVKTSYHVQRLGIEELRLALRKLVTEGRNSEVVKSMGVAQGSIM